MPLDDNYLPKAQNSLPPGFGDIGGAAKVAAPSLPPGFADIMAQMPQQQGVETGLIPSVKRGAANTFASLSNLVGAEETAAAAQAYAAQFPREIETLDDIKNVADLGTYALESGAENLANVLAIVGAGVLTAYTGGGFAIGAVGANFALQAGESKQAIQAEGGDVNALTVGIPATINTAIDTMSFLKLAKAAGVLGKVMGAMDEAATVSGLGSRALKGVTEGGKALVTEGSTEAVQSYNNLWAARLAADQDVRDAFALQGQDIDDLIEAFARGGLGAAVTVGPMAAVTAKTDTNAQLNKKAAQDNKVQEVTKAASVQPTETKPDGTKTVEPEAKPTVVDIKPTLAVNQKAIDDAKKSPEAGAAVGAAVGVAPPVQAVPVETPNDGRLDEPAEVPTLRTEIEKMNVRIALQIAELTAGADPTYLRPTLRDIAPHTYLFTDSQKENATPGTPPDSWLKTVVQDMDGNSITTEMGWKSATKKTYVDTAGLSKNLDEGTIGQLTTLVETLRQQFAPELSISILDMNTFNPGSEAFGSMGFASDRKAMADMAFISLNPAKLRLSSETPVNSMIETLAHEFGHAVAAAKFAKESAKVKATIYKEYQEWLNKALDMTVAEFFKTRMAPANYMRNMKMFKSWGVDINTAKMRDIFNAQQLNYHLGFDEYFADQFARFAMRDKTLKAELSTESKAFWARVYQTMKEIFEAVKSQFAPGTKFEQWLNIVRDQAALELMYTQELRSTKIPASVTALVGEPAMAASFEQNLKEDNIITRIFKNNGMSGITEEQQAAMQNLYRVSTGFTRRWAGRFLTPAQIAERYGVKEAAQYMTEVYKYHTTKMQGITAADGVAKQWMEMPQDRADEFGRFVFEVSEMSDRKRRKLSATEIDALRTKYNISDTEMQLFTDMESTFQEVLDRLYQAILVDTARGFIDAADLQAFLTEYQSTDPIVSAGAFVYAKERATDLANELGKLERSFRKQRRRNYFPRMRFGSYTITLREKQMTTTGKANMVVTEFMTFESAKERDAVYNQMAVDYADKVRSGEAVLQSSKLDDTSRSLYGMPQIVIDKIEKGLEQSAQGLSGEQKALLQDIGLEMSPGKRFMRHMQKRKNTKGFSTEAMRTYASYMSNASNHLARIEHTRDMVTALRELGGLQKGVQGDTTDLAELHSYYTDHFKYLLNPENDFAKLRAFGFIWYLGFNPKSALVNLTQLPMVTYPYLAARYSDAKATKALMKAMADVARHYRNKEGLPEAEQRLLDRMMAEGLFDESMASELAGLSEGTALSRIMPENKAHRVINWINNAASVFFRPAEKYNRMVTSLATFRLHMTETGDFEAAYAAAKEAVHKSQFEYAKYNRPEFMRGLKSAFFLFYNYTQQFLYMSFAGARTGEARGTAIRMWALMLALAGLQGLPFAEYILSTLDLFGTKFKQWTGMENPHVNLRHDLRELFADLGANPDLIMHGAGRYLGAGPFKVLEMFGVPVPNLDITSSIGMGEPLPGFRTNDLRGNPEEMAGQLLLNGLGPIPNIAISIFNGLTSKDPDTWKNLEKTLPIAFRNISKASRYYVRGEETTRGGAQFLLYDGSDPYHVPEIIAQALGFTGTRLSQKRELYGEQMATSLYWTQRRQLLMERYAYAVKTEDRRAKREFLLDIREFNASLSRKELLPYRISRKDLNRSLAAKTRVLRRRELGMPTSDRDRLVYSELEGLYN